MSNDRFWTPGDRFTYLDPNFNRFYGTITRVDELLIFGRRDDDPERELFFHRYSPYVIRGELKEDA